MGLFNKLKNALFEVEEIEIESPKEEKVVIKDEYDTKDQNDEKTVLNSNDNLVNDRELFKAENTFDFPDFDETEFEINYEPPKVKEREVKLSVPNNSYEYEEKIKIRKEPPRYERERNLRTSESPKKVFKPSPIISPVYGVLDKNYTKEDIVTVERSVKVKSSGIDVDMVRKKAFGTLEDDLEKTLNEPADKFFNTDSKSIDELLNETIDDTIEIKKTEIETPKEEKDISQSIEEELDKFEELDEKEEKKEVAESVEDESLENDLFELIDSMYDNKEEE